MESTPLKKIPYPLTDPLIDSCFQTLSNLQFELIDVSSILHYFCVLERFKV